LCFDDFVQEYAKKTAYWESWLRDNPSEIFHVFFERSGFNIPNWEYYWHEMDIVACHIGIYERSEEEEEEEDSD